MDANTDALARVNQLATESMELRRETDDLQATVRDIEARVDALQHAAIRASNTVAEPTQTKEDHDEVDTNLSQFDVNKNKVAVEQLKPETIPDYNANNASTMSSVGGGDGLIEEYLFDESDLFRVNSEELVLLRKQIESYSEYDEFAKMLCRGRDQFVHTDNMVDDMIFLLSSDEDIHLPNAPGGGDTLEYKKMLKKHIEMIKKRCFQILMIAAPTGINAEKLAKYGHDEVVQREQEYKNYVLKLEEKAHQMSCRFESIRTYKVLKEKVDDFFKSCESDKLPRVVYNGHGSPDKSFIFGYKDPYEKVQFEDVAEYTIESFRKHCERKIHTNALRIEFALCYGHLIVGADADGPGKKVMKGIPVIYLTSCAAPKTWSFPKTQIDQYGNSSRTFKNQELNAFSEYGIGACDVPDGKKGADGKKIPSMPDLEFLNQGQGALEKLHSI